MCFVAYIQINAQSPLAEASPINPLTKELENFGVNEATGLANISIPIYNVKIGDLTVPIELQYNSSGIKVEQFASEVGLGWILNAGGYVDKELIGQNDYPVGWTAYEDNITGNYVQSENKNGYLIMNGASKTYDTPDLYHINAPRLSNSFYIDRGFSVIPVSPYNGSKISIQYGRDSEDEVKKYGHAITYQSDPDRYVCGMPKMPIYLMGSYISSAGSGCPYQLKTFYDTQKISVTNNHYTYDFKDFDYVASANHKEYVYNNILDEKNISFAGSRYRSKYWLNKITDNLTKREVNFTYETYAGINSYVKKGGVWNVLLYAPQSNMNIRNYVGDNADLSIKKLVKEISTDNEKLKFFYSYERNDKKFVDITYDSPTNWQLINDPLLKRIEVEDVNGNTKYTFTFNYDYFNSGCNNSEHCYRLKLKNVIKTAGNNFENIVDRFDLDYYEDMTQPKIGSFSKDIFGFNNNLSDATVNDNGLPRRPFLYEYKDIQNGKEYNYYSTLKFYNLNPVTISGSYEQSLSNLISTRAWSLKSIQYLTKGKQQFEYELNQFNWKSFTYNGGGQRIKKITLLDGINSYETNYTYGEGNLVTLPITTDLQQYYAGNKIINQLTDPTVTYFKGSPIVYDEISTLQPNGGKITSKYTSIKDFPFAINIKDIDNNPVTMHRYYYPSGDFTWKYRLRKEFVGLPLNRTYFDNTNKKLKEEIFSYSNEVKDYPTTYPLFKGEKYFGSYYPFNPYSGAIPASVQPDMEINKRYRNNIAEKKTILYHQNGNIITNEKFNFIDNLNLLKSIITTEGNETYKTENLYAFEQGEQYNQQIAADEKVNQIIIGKNKYKNANKVAEEVIKYKYINNQNNPANNQLLPEKIVHLIPEDNIYEDGIQYTLYDSKGNSIETKNKDGIYTSILYGYHQTLPIAKLEGIKYQDVMSILGLSPNNDPNIYLQSDIVKKSDLDIDNNSELQLLSSLNNFRANSLLKDYQITTYTYDPLIGVKSATPPSGIRTSYLYNGAGKLEKILNANGEIIEEFKYNYAPKKYFNVAKSQAFTKNDCGLGMLGTSSTYSVPADKYTSVISQGDADQKAQDEINSNGQNFANTNGTCYYPYCEFNAQTSSQYIMMQYAPFQKANMVVNAQLNFQVISTQGQNWSDVVQLGNVPSPCRPVTTITRTSGNWQITIYPASGQTVLRWLGSGNPSIGSPYQISFNYNLN
jgi:hypothetical protein